MIAHLATVVDLLLAVSVCLLAYPAARVHASHLVALILGILSVIALALGVAL